MNSIIVVIGCSLFCIFNYFSYVNARPKNNREQIKQRELIELTYFLKNSHRITAIISVATKISMITVLFILGQLLYYYCSISSRVCEHYNADRMKSVGFTFGIVSAATSAMLEPTMFGERFLYAGFRTWSILTTGCNFFSCCLTVGSGENWFEKVKSHFTSGRLALWHNNVNFRSLMIVMAKWDKYFNGPFLWRLLVYIVFNIILYYIICSSLGIRELLKP